MKKIAIVDTHKEGHHYDYLYGIYCFLTKNQIKADIYCNSGFKTYLKNYQVNKNPPSEVENLNLVTDILDEPTGSWLQKTKIAYNNLKRVEGYDTVIFMYMNLYFLPLVLYRLRNNTMHKVRGLYFNPYLRQDKNVKNIVRNLVFNLLVLFYNNLKIFVLNDSEVAKELNEKYKTDLFNVLKDPIPTFYYQRLKKRTKNIDIEYDFILIGIIEERKGIFQLFNAIKKMDPSFGFSFLLAGKVESKVSVAVNEEVKILQKAGYNIELKDKYLTNAEFAGYIMQSDVVLLPYITKGASSGILGHAAYAKKPILGTEFGLIGQIIKNYRLGETFNPFDTDKFAKLLKEKKSINFDNFTRSEYVKENNFSSFCRNLLRDLNSKNQFKT